MKKLTQLACLLGILIFTSCSQKVHFLGADKQEYEVPFNQDEDINIDAFFTGDAIDYIVFELDINNKTQNEIHLDYKNVHLKYYDDISQKAFIIPALNKDDVINNLNSTKNRIKREKTSRDIGNVLSIGLNLLSLGAGSGAGNLDVLLYASESAAYMFEDARSHKLLTGSIEEQIEYVNQWVLSDEILKPEELHSFDVLFERRLLDSEADLVVEINNKEYKVPFLLRIIEEKVR